MDAAAIRDAVLRHVRALQSLGLVLVPTQPGGLTLRGLHHAEIADCPLKAQVHAPGAFLDGVELIAGTAHPAGGFIIAADVDDGPTTFAVPICGFLYMERGTRANSWHLVLRTADQLRGQLLLRDDARTADRPRGQLVAELKGRGLGLRLWPTVPVGKTAGYTPLAMAWRVDPSERLLTVREVAAALSDYLSRALGRQVDVPQERGAQGQRWISNVPHALAEVVEAELGARGCCLRAPTPSGWQAGRCPLHQDRRPSFAVNLLTGSWVCHAGCGSGGLRSLAGRLGISTTPPVRWRKGRPQLPVVEVAP